jgi:branched-chain amino acid aminotransferase
LKLTDRSLYEKAEKFANENNLDDSLILNEYGHICESTIANIFWIKDNMIYTPPLSEGCVAGVMRKYLMEKMRDAGYGIQEKKLSIEELFGAEEVFFTNAIRGIRGVTKFRDKIYTNEKTLKIKNKVLKNFFN